MKDFPMFTTENGVASLVLKEIPYRQEAYILLRATQRPEELLEECASFCRICGAQKVYASGHSVVERYPIHTAIYEMRGQILPEPDRIAQLFPVTSQTVARWRELYNQAMRPVPNAGTLEAKDEQRLIAGETYFVHREGQLLGIGYLSEDTLEAMACFVPGQGMTVLHTLASIHPDTPLRLEVASENRRAVALYEKAGFFKVKELSTWYSIE